jgi:hypothetical protein
MILGIQLNRTATLGRHGPLQIAIFLPQVMGNILFNSKRMGMAKKQHRYVCVVLVDVSVTYAMFSLANFMHSCKCSFSSFRIDFTLSLNSVSLTSFTIASRTS